MLTLNVGLSRKLGLPNYSSIGADCHLALELPGDIMDEPEALRRRIRLAYEIAALAVQEELARQQGAADKYEATAAGKAPAAPAAPPSTSGHAEAPLEPLPPKRKTAKQPKAAPAPGPTPTRTAPAPAGPPATEAQIRCLYGRCKALRLDIDTVLADAGIGTLEELTKSRASELIDSLGSARTNGRHGPDPDPVDEHDAHHPNRNDFHRGY